MATMSVVVPDGVQPGQPFMMQAPDGQQMQVVAQVPAGQPMQVQLPNAPVAQAVAQPVGVQMAPMAPQPMMMGASQPMMGGSQVVCGPPQMVAGFTPMTVTGYAPEVFAVPVAEQVVMGIPADPSMFTTATFGAMDPVPMLDATTAGMIGAVNKFKVRQRTRFMEAITQGACEQRNIYDISDFATGQPLFTAVEYSDGCLRCCCAPHHAFNLKFKPPAPGAPIRMLDSMPASMTMERNGVPNKCLGCCVCSEMCMDGFYLHAGDIQGEAGSVAMSSGRVMGVVTQPKWGGGLTPTLNVMERGDAAGSKWGTLAKIEGPTIFGGCTELCCESNWPVSRMTNDTFGTKLMVGDFATITKKTPKGCGQAITEAMTDSDTYTIEFKEGMQLAPQQKALMLASLLQIDYMFFEKDNGMCSCEGSKIKITLCNCYCCGCSHPINIEFDSKNSGGAPPASDTMER